MELTVAGRRVYAYTGGKDFDPALPCVAFVHGALHDHTAWTLLARWCAHHGFGVLATDLPGHMRSEGPALESVEAMADWLLALLDAAGVERAALVGHSMGSLVALEAAARAPQRASRLVMVATAFPMKVAPALLALARDDPHRAIDLVIGYSYASLAPKPSYPGPGGWIRGGARALMRQVLEHQGDALLYHRDFAACDGYANGLAAAARVACPATLLLAREDQMTPPKAAGEIEAALRARRVMLPGGHVVMAEAPDATLAALREALA